MENNKEERFECPNCGSTDIKFLESVVLDMIIMNAVIAEKK